MKQLSDGLIKANLETLKKERPQIFNRDKEKLEKMMLIKSTFEKLRDDKSLEVETDQSMLENTYREFYEQAHFFKKRDTFIVEFYKYLRRMMIIPHRTYKLYDKIQKIKKKMELSVKNLEKKYNENELNKDEKNKNLVLFLEKFKYREMEIKRLEMVIEDTKSSDETKEQAIKALKEATYKMLKEKKDKIKGDPKIKQYFLDRITMDKLKDKTVKLQITYNRIKKETVFFDTNMSRKMNKYFDVSKIHLLELNYIKNEFDLSNYFDIDISQDKKKEYLSNIETTYIFYYSLKQKLKQLSKTLSKGQRECNDEYKKIVKEHVKLLDESKKVILEKDKKKIEEQIILIKKDIKFFKYNFNNIKRCIFFCQDLIMKTRMFLITIEYYRQYCENLILAKNLRKLLIYQKEGLIEAPTLDFIKRENLQLDLNQKKLEKVLKSVQDNQDTFLNTMKRFFVLRAQFLQDYDECLEEAKRLAFEIREDRPAINPDVKKLRNVENRKKLQLEEDMKLKYEEVLQEISLLNNEYQKIGKPMNILFATKIVKRVDKKSKKKLKKKSKKTKKKKIIKVLRFNEKLLDKYSIKVNSDLKNSLRKINSFDKRINKFFNFRTLNFFIPKNSDRYNIDEEEEEVEEEQKEDNVFERRID